MRGVHSRNKGKSAEREVAAILRKYGFHDARRGQQFRGSPDSPDVVGLPSGYHAEVKRQERLLLEAWCAQAETDAGPGVVPLVIFRRSRQPWRVVLPLTDLLPLL